MGHGHDAADVVLLLTVLLFGEVSNQVTSLLVVPGENVEKEGLHVVVERLVVQEQLDKKAKVLTIDFVCVPVHLVDGEVVLPVDLGAWRVTPGALLDVTPQNRPRLHVLEAKLAEEQLGQAGVLVRVGRRVPGGNLVFAELDGQRRPGRRSGAGGAGVGQVWSLTKSHSVGGFQSRINEIKKNYTQTIKVCAR